MKLGTKYLLQGAVVATLLLSVVGGHAATPAPAWPTKWPSSVAENTRLQDELVKTDYTAEEKRNILTILNEESDEARAAWLKDPKRAPHEGFPGLDKYYGAKGYDEATSIPDRKDRILDILAKDNRVFGAYVISGHHQGTMWGWKGDGKPVEILAFFYRTFDPQGRTIENYFHTEELQLYVALGGKAEFPKDGIAAQIAEAPKPGAPTPPRTPPAPLPALTSWPPTPWPEGVISPKLKKWLAEAHWTEEEKQNLWKALHANTFVAGDYNTPQDFTVAPFCGITCTRRRGFDYLDYLSGIHGYNAARSVRDRFVETDDVIAKGSRVIRVFKGHGHQTGYFYGFPGDGHALEFIEIGTGNAGVGGRAEELQLFVAMGGKLQFPGKPPVP
ncbi:MAG TPA: hypothetical protein VL358_00835 [Caulobacteraceae bacterium]|jgi:predicted ester cyclase|nr:hypothetical protein [Caulobacteraceae bacterium]